MLSKCYRIFMKYSPSIDFTVWNPIKQNSVEGIDLIKLFMEDKSYGKIAFFAETAAALNIFP